MLDKLRVGQIICDVAEIKCGPHKVFVIVAKIMGINEFQIGVGMQLFQVTTFSSKR